jgi:hypothetical protein
MIVRHAHELASTSEPYHLATPWAIVTVMVAAYFSIPDWYLTQVVTIAHDHGVRLLAMPAMIWHALRLHLVVPMARMARDSGSWAVSCRHH